MMVVGEKEYDGFLMMMMMVREILRLFTLFMFSTYSMKICNANLLPVCPLVE